MKKIAIILLICFILASCATKNASKPEFTTNSNVASVTNIIKEQAREETIDIVRLPQYIPEIISDSIKSEEVKISKYSEGEVFVEFLDINNPYIDENYEISSFFVSRVSTEAVDVEMKTKEKEEYKEYLVQSKKILIRATYNELLSGRMLISLIYQIDAESICCVTALAKENKEITNQVAEKLYNDFQCVPTDFSK